MSSVILAITLCLIASSQASDCGCSDTFYPVVKVGQSNCSCQPKRAGQLKFAGGKLFVCTGTEWKALQFEVSGGSGTYGSTLHPGSSCEDIMKKNSKPSANGVYWITLSGRSSDLFPVYCDMAAGGWTMVFKAVSGVDKSVYNTYNSGQTYSERVMAALDVTNKYHSHYKNRILLNWKKVGPSEARVVLYKGGKLLKELTFNTQGSDKLNWFSRSRLTQSPWSDIKIQPQNYFSILGMHNRNFFINRNYGGCPGDDGWLAITGYDCGWEKHYWPRKNVILYSKLSGYTNWGQYKDVGVADVLAVFLR